MSILRLIKIIGKMKILITGGAGFIGSNYIEYLFNIRKGYDIVVVDKLNYASNIHYLDPYMSLKNFKFIKEDISNLEEMDKIFKEEKFDIVLNFAAESSVDRSFDNESTFFRSNVLGVINLINLSIKYNVSRFHQVSTDEVYGSSLGVAYKEDSSLNPSNPYSLSKATADNLIVLAMKTKNLKATISRSTNNFGPHQFTDKLIPRVIKYALDNKKIPIYGNGNNVRDWLYVKDHCRAIDLIIEKGKIGEIYNIGGDNYLSNNNLIKEILTKLDKPDKLMEYVKDRPNHDFGYAVDDTKIKTKLGWKIESNFDDELSKTIDYYVNYFKNNL
jgi:dTDP-glucose 4,6-dehydratase